MKRVLFIGPSPLETGGISIHIRRLAGIMKNDYNLDYVDEGHVRHEGMFNLRSGNVFKYLSKVSKGDIVHINSGIWSLRLAHIVVAKMIFRKRVVVTIHRDPNIEPHTNLTKRFLRRCDVAILVNREGYESMRTEGRCKYMLLPAFLPPMLDEEPQLLEGITKWIEKARRKGKTYLMTSNAWNLVMHGGEDLYGLDICIEAMAQLKDNAERNYHLIFVVASNTGQQERMETYKREIKQRGLQDRILIWEEPVSFVRLLQECDMVLRATNTDGDAVSVREALYFGKPVVASDVVGRPDGVELFKTRDTEDLVRAIKQASFQCVHAERQERVDYHELYRRLYEGRI